jgi:pSer/pThr/pTyr-binding forkhead associated (FHA) protein
MEPTSGLPAERLIADLNRLRLQAGSPSLDELVRLSRRTLSRSTLHDHLAGRRTRLPPWPLVSAYVSACHAAAENTGLNVQRLGTLEDWHDKWVAAADDHDVTSETADGKGTELNTKPYSVHGNRAEPSSHPVVGDRSAYGEYGDTTASVSIAPVIRRLEEDISSLGRSLPPHTGLLVLTSGPTIGTRYVIEHNITTIGRVPESDIWLNDPTVSRHHAVIYRHGDSFFVRDRSRNGTLVRQKLVEAETRLFGYDELRIAEFTLMFLQAGQKTKESHKSYRPIRERLIEDISASTDDFRAAADGGSADYDLPPWTVRHPRLWRRPRS